MTNNDVVKIISSMPEARQIGGASYWRVTVPILLPTVLDEIVISYDFDFIMNEYSTVVTVVGQADYEVQGANRDLRDIVSIRYGADKKVLTKLRPLDADDLLSGGATLGATNAWYQFKLTNDGYPIVTLFDAPGSAGDALHVRYRMKDVPVERFPSSFSWVIAHGVLSYINTGHRLMFERALKKMIKRYKTGGKDINLTQIDPHLVLGHTRRADLTGIG